ncbi:unnamed protein product [Schistosoma haematobium]|nr:unnamed protein product [Schistosoma haematobium]CAH8681862.1 unnamed protein product [Schistosoma haematobium]
MFKKEHFNRLKKISVNKCYGLQETMSSGGSRGALCFLANRWIVCMPQRPSGGHLIYTYMVTHQTTGNKSKFKASATTAVLF